MSEYEAIYNKISDMQLKAIELEDDAEYRRFERYPQYQFDWLTTVTNFNDLLTFNDYTKQSDAEIRNQLKQCRFRIDRGSEPSTEFQGFLLTVLSIIKGRLKHDEAVN